jgi:chaperonin cofactor prefoldin
VRTQWLVYLATAMLAGAAGGALLAPAPVGAVAREIVELQQGVQQLMQGQKDLQTAIAQESAVQKTLIELSLDSVNKLSGTMDTVQKSVQEIHANSGARLDTMSTQVQALSESLQEVQARIGKLNQQLTDAQNSIQSIDTKLDCSMPAPAGARDSKIPKH